ncbi:MAG: zeta toxin family protein [Gemmataceae bacterium]|nr:zeta toxin family protein [Gemmataceae bacterium]
MIAQRTPSIVVIAGPNGAGKSTIAPHLLRSVLQIPHFVNADAIAKGLSFLHPETVSFTAGRIMLRRMEELAVSRADFAFETTLASRTLAPWLTRQLRRGFDLRMVFLWLPDPSLAIARVSSRVQMGGHHVPEDTIRRRYEAGIRNFFHLFMPLTAAWAFYDNSGQDGIRELAWGSGREEQAVADPAMWDQLKSRFAA